MKIAPLFQTDYYKTGHYAMYPPGTTKVYSNLTPRKSRIHGVNSVVVFGLQYWIIEYIIRQWTTDFFGQRYVDGKGDADSTETIYRYKRMMDCTLGLGAVDMEHIEKLWDLGYMPLHIKALPEGSLCPIGVPCMTITNTVDHAYWLVNYLETIMSCTIWQPMTSATIAHEYKKLCLHWAKKTGGDPEFANWQCHDFSMRGMSSLESACTSGAGHLLSFTGTDTIPAISFLEHYYGANIEKELVGASVPATEHAVMCMGGKDGELATFRRLINQYTTGIISIVSDTWDLWTVLTEYLPACKADILKENRKVVIRPDSGDPVEILCGVRIPTLSSFNEAARHFSGNVNGSLLFKVDGVLYKVKPGSGAFEYGKYEATPAELGVIELLWNEFGGTFKFGEDGRQYKQLDSHIGAIYGDSITPDRTLAIFERLAEKGFSSTCTVLGVGSYTYQHNTRDTFGFAVKATYGEVEVLEEQPHSGHGVLVKQAREIFKDPITDDGTKKSAKGLLRVNKGVPETNGLPWLADKCSQEDEQGGLLETVFLNGELKRRHTLAEIRERLSKQL